jgi:hypothetical protein
MFQQFSSSLFDCVSHRICNITQLLYSYRSHLLSVRAVFTDDAMITEYLLHGHSFSGVGMLKNDTLFMDDQIFLRNDYYT